MNLKIIFVTLILLACVAVVPSFGQVPINVVKKQVEQLNSKDSTNKLAEKPASGALQQGTPGKEEGSKKTVKQFITEVQQWLLTVGLQISLILLLMALALKSTSSFSKRLLVTFTKNKEGTELKKRADTLTSVVRYVCIVIIIGIAGMMILRELNIDIGPILAGAGVVGLAVGFGAQNLVKDIISGFFILLEDQIRVGDVVQIADKSGTVEKVTLRMVILRDIHCNVHYIPSGEISVVTNMTKKYSAYVFDVGVAYRENIDEVIEIMKEVDEELRADADFKSSILEPLEVFGLQKFDDSAVIVRARTKTKPVEQWRIGREFNKRLKERFDKAGVEIPFPHMTVYPGEDKEGNSPPLNIGLTKELSKVLHETGVKG